MTGRRLPDSLDGSYPRLEPGDYIKILGGSWKESKTGPLWIIRAPNGETCYLNAAHTFVEHEDGTLTVSPSIAIREKDVAGNTIRELYHGYLERGVWRTA